MSAMRVYADQCRQEGVRRGFGMLRRDTGWATWAFVWGCREWQGDGHMLEVRLLVGGWEAMSWHAFSGSARRGLVRFGCHGIPERCIKIGEWRMPFCARCLGASIGHLLSIGLAISGAIVSPTLGASLVGLMLIDWGLQRFCGIASTNPRRLATGIAGGFGVNTLIFSGFRILLGLIT
ncbi:MAG: DUF2085 domain-containing protein [Methanothrix sp.]|nr:MAG: DUF2085 domain-containing protein [Methanothrix sp.]